VPARRLLALAVLALVVLVVAWRHASAGGPAGGAALRVAPIVPSAPVGRAPAAASALVVDVAGAVRRPGLVHLAKGARVADAVARAGGLTRRADRSGVNFAAPVSDGQQVLVPERGAVGGGAGGAAGAGASAGPVSLSLASAEQLDTLPGIGPVTAQKIVTYREQHGAFNRSRRIRRKDALGWSMARPTWSRASFVRAQPIFSSDYPYQIVRIIRTEK
jgi:competence protein ComEA